MNVKASPVFAALPEPLPVSSGVSTERMAGGFAGCLHHGPAKRQLLRGLLLGSHEPDVCGRGDELAVDGDYRRLRPCGEGGSRGLLGESYLTK